MLIISSWERVQQNPISPKVLITRSVDASYWVTDWLATADPQLWSLQQSYTMPLLANGHTPGHSLLHGTLPRGRLDHVAATCSRYELRQAGADLEVDMISGVKSYDQLLGGAGGLETETHTSGSGVHQSEVSPVLPISVITDWPTCPDGGCVGDRRAGANLQSQRDDGQVLRPPVQPSSTHCPSVVFYSVLSRDNQINITFLNINKQQQKNRSFFYHKWKKSPTKRDYEASYE